MATIVEDPGAGPLIRCDFCTGLWRVSMKDTFERHSCFKLMGLRTPPNWILIGEPE